MKCHIVMTERYDRNENVLGTAKHLSYALHFKPFQFNKGLRAIYTFLMACNKKDVPGRKKWETSEVVVRLWEK